MPYTLFSNHGHVLFLLATKSDITIREISIKVGITERTVANIISDLEKDGFIEIIKEGRKNIYKIIEEKHFRHELEKHCEVKDFIEIIKSKRNA